MGFFSFFPTCFPAFLTSGSFMPVQYFLKTWENSSNSRNKLSSSLQSLTSRNLFLSWSLIWILQSFYGQWGFLQFFPTCFPSHLSVCTGFSTLVPLLWRVNTVSFYISVFPNFTCFSFVFNFRVWLCILRIEISSEPKIFICAR